MKTSLIEMKKGQNGKVIDITGGQGARRRLEALGIRVGKNITKQSAMIMRGPITVKVGYTLVGIGHGMAAKVIVEVLDKVEGKQ